MSSRKTPRVSANRVTVGILVVLTATNGVWTIASGRSGPAIALLFYALVAWLCWRRNHFQAGMIAGAFGLGIHIFEWTFQDLGKLAPIDLAFFCANIVFPIPLMYFSYKAQRTISAGAVEA